MRSSKVCLLLALIFCFSKACPDILKDRLVLSHLVHDIRDPQTDKKHFRGAVEKIGEYLALEVLARSQHQGCRDRNSDGSKSCPCFVR